MLQTLDCVEPDFNLGKGVRCVMLTRKFLETKSKTSKNFLNKITRKVSLNKGTKNNIKYIDKDVSSKFLN